MASRTSDRWLAAAYLTVGVGLICGGIVTADPVLVGGGLLLFIMGAMMDVTLNLNTPRHP